MRQNKYITLYATRFYVLPPDHGAEGLLITSHPYIRITYLIKVMFLLLITLKKTVSCYTLSLIESHATRYCGELEYVSLK